MRSYVHIRRFLTEERGATAIEYGIICGMIAVFVLGITSTGGAVTMLYEKMAAIGAALLNGGADDGGGG